MTLNTLKKQMWFYPTIIFFLILLANGVFFSWDFFSISIVDGHLYGRIIDIFRNGSKLILLALGMTMVLATGGTDISVGSVMAISATIACGVVSGQVLPYLGGSVPLAIVLALIAGTLCGLWNGFLVSIVKIQPIVATMILMVAGRGIAQLIADGKILTINSDAYYYLNGGYVFGLPMPLLIAVFFLVILAVFTRKTAFGLFVETTGCNPVAARLVGIPVSKLKIAIYGLSGFMAGMAGLIESAGIKGADANNAGLLIEMDAILAVAIGGTFLSGGKFSLVSSVIGALIIQSITTSVYAIGVPPETTLVVKALIVVVICLIQSTEFKASFQGFINKTKKGYAR